ncbi:hypothetical protein AB1N83_013418 [Pleurotus pulmonarius]
MVEGPPRRHTQQRLRGSKPSVQVNSPARGQQTMCYGYGWRRRGDPIWDELLCVCVVSSKNNPDIQIFTTYLLLMDTEWLVEEGGGCLPCYPTQESPWIG